MLSYREATVDDAPSIARVEVKSKRASIPNVVSEIEMDYDWSLNRWVGYLNKTSSPRFAEEHRIVFLACDGERVVGYAACHHTTKRGIEGELQSIYVLKEYQRQGIGTTLIMRVVKWLLANGKNSLLTGYYGKNPYVRFYQKLGADLSEGPAIWQNLRQLSDAQGWTETENSS